MGTTQGHALRPLCIVRGVEWGGGEGLRRILGPGLLVLLFCSVVGKRRKRPSSGLCDSAGGSRFKLRIINQISTWKRAQVRPICVSFGLP